MRNLDFKRYTPRPKKLLRASLIKRTKLPKISQGHLPKVRTFVHDNFEASYFQVRYLLHIFFFNMEKRETSKRRLALILIFIQRYGFRYFLIFFRRFGNHVIA